MTPESPGKRGLIWTATVGAIAWVGTAFGLVPSVIRSAYDQQSFAFLNRLIEGRDVHPVERYLDLWSIVALRLSLLLVLLGAGALILRWQRERVGRVVASVCEGLPRVTDSGLLVSSIFLGMLFGFAEAVRATTRYWVFHRAAGERVSGELFWMAPVAGCLTLLILALPWVAVRRGARWDERWNGLLLFLSATLCFYGFGRSLQAGLHPFALLILAAGLAAQISGIARRRPGGFRRTSRWTAGVGAVLLILWALLIPDPSVRGSEGGVAAGAASATATSPNILLIVWDTVRARSLSLYGNGRATTPNLDALSRQSVVFDAAVSTAPWTLPAHASLFTGRYPHEHLAGRDVPLADTYPTLAEAAAGLGYQTAGFVANTYWVGRGFGLDRGFGHYEDRPPVSLAAVLASWYPSRTLHARLSRFAGDRDGPLRISARSINDSFMNWLDERDEQRAFFVFMNLFDAHEPYLPPDGFGFEFSEGTPRYTWDYTRPIVTPDPELQELRDAYDSCIYYLDHELGRLVDALRDRGLLENTVLILTSDHGETLGEHAPDLLGHENNVYYDVLHVPLIVHYPGGLQGGTRSNELVSLTDVPATVWDLAGAAGENPFPGRSLVPLFGEAAGDSLGSGRLLLSEADPAEWHSPDFSWPISKGPLYSLVGREGHYIVNAEGTEQLFDPWSDPWERNDLSGTPGGRAALPGYREELERQHGRADTTRDSLPEAR